MSDYGHSTSTPPTNSSAIHHRGPTSPPSRIMSSVGQRTRPTRSNDSDSALDRASKPSSACVTCRLKKVRCSGIVPCEYCIKRGLDCKKQQRGRRRLYSVSRLQELEARLAQYEGVNDLSTPEVSAEAPEPSVDGLEEGSMSPDPNASNPSPALIIDERSLEQPSARLQSTRSPRDRVPSFLPTTHAVSAATHQLSPPHPSFSPRTHGPGSFVGDREVPNSSPESAIIADSALSSSNTFGSRVLELLGPSRTRRPRSHNNPSATPSTNGGRDSEPIPSLPTQEEAYELLDVVNLIIGHAQSHYDSRAFSDKVEAFYANQQDPANYRTLWFLEMIVVFAIGKLFSGRFDDGDDQTKTLPGIRLFDYADRNLPTLGEIYKHGRLGVEMFALMAVYLQNVDRKEEAYIYISSALRIAVAHGFHRRSGLEKMLRSEKVQTIRLWWTVYMQERRLAAATGNPCAVSDDTIEIDLPSDSPGFASAAPIRINTKIAKVTGRIIAVIYGARDVKEDEFISKVQDIVQCLNKISKEIPSDVCKDVNGPGPDQPIRTSASLQLMLCQATLLTIRPIMLHVSHLIMSGNLPRDELLDSSSLGRLSRTCSEAARHLLNIVIALRKRNILAIYGFFDCDAAFSAAFIMILTAIFDSACAGRERIDPSPGLKDAVETLQYLADHNNNFAVQRLEEVKRVCALLSPYIHKSTPLGDDVPQLSSSRPEQDGSNTGVMVDSLGPPSAHQEQNPSTRQDSVGQREPGAGQSQDRVASSETDVWMTSRYDGYSPTVLPPGLWNDISYLWYPAGGGSDGGLGYTLAGDATSGDFQNRWHSFLFNSGVGDYTGEDLGDFAAFEHRIAYCPPRPP